MNKIIKNIVTWSVGIALLFAAIGFYAPYYSISEQSVGHETLGDYHEEKAPDITGFKKFVGLAGIVVFDTISFGLFFDALAKNQKASEMLTQSCNPEKEI